MALELRKHGTPRQGGGGGDGGREVSCGSVVSKKLPTEEPQTFQETKEVKTFSSLMAKREV